MSVRLLTFGSPLLLFFAFLAAADPTGSTTEAVQRWQLGQEALRNGDVDAAIALYRKSLDLDGKLNRNLLSLAAAFSAKGDDAQAVDFLSRYVEKQPDHVMARVHLAEMLLRLGRRQAARLQFERCARELQDSGDGGADRLIHCEAKLMELAEEFEDEYAEHLHRGIGLYLLACQSAAIADPDSVLAGEGLLFRATRELNCAWAERPDEARPCWYLHKAWAQLAQQQQATRWLHAAQDAAAFSDLSTAERAELRTKWHRLAVAQIRK
jgi:tetratricopeptide (TPR) repeat protein